ncbi:SigE family RNA polymerase sigma factor [Nocardioides guangzhouensis]|uniref:SigE family RNA polymerase sigma factor n=1 Tax=Nocardioides guangzhouensis TaxID=2497878 RepID=A0A4Q4ZCV8_9ACTN|nr:SigE family RNA polymerase sigma factor [Nocardioides guangzhouensis]RYP85900.1 SigE family RNA polymerase sigma factor [Nocardioides guangzhouensis]
MSEEILSRQPRRVADQQSDALRDVFEGSYRRLVVQLYAVTGDSVEAEDLVQEAFVRAVAAGHRFLRADNPEAWLRTVAINLHRNRWRKLRNYSRIRHRIEEPRDLAGLEEHVVVVNALRSLPAEQREVIALHHLADLSVTEVAEVLGCKEGTVKSRLKRGRDALAKVLGPWEGGSDE